MNNHRLLTGALAVALMSCGAMAQERVYTLEEIFDTADSQSRQLRPSLSAITEAERQTEVARSRRLPDIEASLSLSYIGDGFTTRRNFTDYQRAPIPHFGSGIGVSITQPVYTGGAVTASVDMARLGETASRFEAEMQRDNVHLHLAGYYLDLYKCLNLRTVVERNIETAKRVVADMRARYEEGVSLLNDITRYELLLSNLELQLVKLDNTRTILNSNLVLTAGLPEGAVILPDSTMLSRSLECEGEAWWQTEATTAPRLSLARNGVSMSRTAERIARSSLLPKVGLQAAWTLDGPILVEVPPINRNLSYWYVGIGVSYNLSSLYKGRRDVAKSRAATATALSRLDAERDNLEMDVRAAYISYLEAREELKTQEKSVELANRNYHTVSTRFAEGMALITDMLDAANSKLDAEQREVNARINIIYNYYKLLFITSRI